MGLFGGHGIELLILLVIVVLIFGVGKFGDVGGAVGKSIREFRQESSRTDTHTNSDDSSSNITS